MKNLSIFILFLLYSCDYKYVDESRFVGKWKLKSDNIYNNMIIDIKKENGKLTGYIDSIPDQKLLKQYLSNGQIWLKGFERRSNFIFDVSESKPASDLFSLYGLPTSTAYEAEFLSDSTFGLSNASNPNKTKILWTKIK